MPDSDGSIAVLVLAAGQGTRMKSSRSKVLHEIAGRPMLDYPVTLAEALAPEQLIVVIGRDAEEVEAAFAGRASFALQAEQKGTAHAVQTALPSLAGFQGDVLVLYGDTPLLRAESVARLIDLKADTGAPLAMLTSPEPLPGLVVRDAEGRVERIVEKTDATAEQLASLREGNTGVYLVDMEFLTKALSQLDDRNEQGELYLTDIVAIARAQGLAVEAIQMGSAEEALGVNNRAELARASAVQRARNADRLMAEGVTFIDPAASYVDTGVEIGPDTLIEPGVTITGNTRIGSECHIKPHCVIESSQIGDGCVIGPSAHVRPGCRLADGVRLGNYVEVKNSDLGPGVKADHLSYVGDADVGAGSSFGCGSITVNYDWTDKHRTTVGERVRIGCNVNLVAPVDLEDDSFVAAGTTVTKTVESDDIAVSTGRQRNLAGWGAKRRARLAARPGTTPEDPGSQQG
ncbi:MAG: UDP-N-acetylglucosamine diphosphorylase/glucosamine-1-phosphate N-acetyltransferase [Deltaproteobacteria bacterium]|nr:UDP-N-acetylglucosamine diphosphorylase/glucosamine-1-phosphate N-acetyltransferase [Deltaproteobacteria bacterium]